MGLDRALDLCGKPSPCFFATISDFRPTFGRNKHDSPMILLPSRCRGISVSDMEATSIFLASRPRPRPIPVTCRPATRKHSSLGHSIKQLHYRRTANVVLAYESINLSLRQAEPRPFPLPRCSLSGAMNPSSQPVLLKPFKNLSFDWLKQKVYRLTPLDIVKASGILSISIAATRWAVNLALNPFFWMYFSWSWLFWPWIVALLVAVSGLYCLRKHLQGKASIFEQLVLVTSVFTWLTLVPAAHFNGFLQGWPFVFFFVYHYFFFFNVSIRRRMYGDYYARPHDPKWDVDTPGWQRLLFCVAVMVGHWLAAFEGPELHRIPCGWSNLGIWLLILATFLTQYNSSLYLAKYSEKIVVPTSVVQYGPYRWVRHPIYASTMLLFATYCAALRAPLSMLFVVGACVLYYEQKIRLEEALMIETFGEGYLEYGRKVKHKLIPFVY